MIDKAQLDLMLRAFGAKVTIEGSPIAYRNYLTFSPSDPEYALLEKLHDLKLVEMGNADAVGKVVFFFTEAAADFLNIKLKGNNYSRG